MRKPHARRDEVLSRLNQPGSPSIGVLAEEVGVSKVTIYGWIQNARKRALQSATESLGGRQVTARKRKDRSPSEKLRLVNESGALKGEALAAFVREHGVIKWGTCCTPLDRPDTLNNLAAFTRE